MARMTDTQTGTGGQDGAADTRTQDGTETRTRDGVATGTPDQDRTPDRDGTANPAGVGEPDGGPVPSHPSRPGSTGTGRRTGRVKVYIRAPGRHAAGHHTGHHAAESEGSFWRSVTAWVASGGYLTALTVVVAVVAALGQKVFAETKAGFVKLIVINGWDLTPWLSPAVFDLAVAAMLREGIRNSRRRHSPWLWWAGAGVVGAVSVYTNARHAGAWITGSASAGLFIMWFLRLYYQHRDIVRAREVEDSVAEKMVSTDVLFGIDRKLAALALRIAQTKPLAAAVAYRHQLGEIELSERDVAILAARQYTDIYTNELYVLMNPHRFPEQSADAAPADGKPTQGKKEGKKVAWWHLRRRSRARWLAALTAGDNVDYWLGLPVPDRRGVVISRITYAATDTTPRLGAAALAAQTPAPALPAASAAAPAAPALPPAHGPRSIAARPHKARDAGIPLTPDAFYYEEEGGQQVPAAAGAPSGKARADWVPINMIEGLPSFDPQTPCGHSADPGKPCTYGTLALHLERRGRQLRMIIQAVPDWSDPDRRRLGKNDVKTICGVGSDQQTEICGLLDHLRRITLAQRAEANAAASSAASVIDAES